MNNNVITIRLSDNGIVAYNFLKRKKMKPSMLLKQGGEILVIEHARKVGLKERIKKYEYPF
mgnify:CR=1 FL=1